MLVDIHISNPSALFLPYNLQRWVEQAFNHFNLNKVELNIHLAELDEMQTFNHDYRAKNKPTNILSFPFTPPPGLPTKETRNRILGDLIICPKVLENEAKEQQKSLDDHWCHILIHGILHLLGYDHIDDLDAEKMESIEILLLAQFSINNPYIEN